MQKSSKSSKTTKAPTEEKEFKTKEGYPTQAKALDDFQRAFDYKKKFLDQADDDFKVALGQIWDPEDEKKLDEIGVKALSINKIAPIIRLIKGIESQNRSDPKAFPEGKEDSLEAEISSGLLKNVSKNADAPYKISDTFDDSNTCGESFLEPYLDFSDNILVGKLQLKKTDYWNIFPDPQAKEYDLSDGEFLCKITYDLTQDQLIQMFPDKDTEIEALDSGKIILSGNTMNTTDALGVELQKRGYNDDDDDSYDFRRKEKQYDLLEYYYKRYITKFYVGDRLLGGMKEAQDKKSAMAYIGAANAQKPDSAVLIRKHIPEIWVMSIVGGMDDPLSDERSWSYPRWKSWPIIPCYCYRSTARISSKFRHLKVQGITRQLKDLQFSYVKRKTQELRHLNQSANSGWLTPENAWVDRDKVEKAGAVPGINLEYKADIGKPERIFPTPLSQGHAQLAQENSQDMKDSSGINTDLLAMSEQGSDSGRAIALRQKQGMTMVQGIFDNLSRTKSILFKFALSQLSEMYTIETAQKVMGEAFMEENFMKPVMAPVIGPQGTPIIDPATRQPAMQPQIDPATGQPAMEPDQQAAQMAFSKVLQDTELGNYDVAVGDVVSSETIQYANFQSLMDMASKGMPIPPEVLIDESLLPQASKNKIKSAIQAQQQAAAAAGQPTGGKNAKTEKAPAAA